MLVSRPGPSQEIVRPSVQKKQARKNKPLTQEKNKDHLSTELASVWPEKKQMPQGKKKGAARQPEREKAFWASPESFFPSGQAAHPGSAQGIVRPSVRKKTGPEKQTADARKKQIRICFFKRQSDGKLAIKYTFPYQSKWNGTPNRIPHLS